MSHDQRLCTTALLKLPKPGPGENPTLPQPTDLISCSTPGCVDATGGTTTLSNKDAFSLSQLVSLSNTLSSRAVTYFM